MVPKKKPAAPKRNTTLGRFLAQLREAKQLTLRQVEDVADVSNAYLSQLRLNEPRMDTNSHRGQTRISQIPTN
jgi:transcriptional regulator with XRE-family HTH domain